MSSTSHTLPGRSRKPTLLRTNPLIEIAHPGGRLGGLVLALNGGRRKTSPLASSAVHERVFGGTAHPPDHLRDGDRAAGQLVPAVDTAGGLEGRRVIATCTPGSLTRTGACGRGFGATRSAGSALSTSCSSTTCWPGAIGLSVRRAAEPAPTLGRENRQQ